MPRSDAVSFDSERKVGLEAERLPGAAGVGCVPFVTDEFPLRGLAAIVECGLADQLDLDLALEALDRPNEHVVGGGARVSGPADRSRLATSAPVDGTDADNIPDDGWTTNVYNVSGAAKQVTPFAIPGTCCSSHAVNISCCATTRSISRIASILVRSVRARGQLRHDG